MKKTLLIILSERLSSIIAKGEVTERYYNPNNLFDVIHLVLLNNDKPDLIETQRMVGTAKLHIHNFPTVSPILSMGYRSFFLKQWISKLHPLIVTISPNLIRSYGNFINSIVGFNLSRKYNIPHIISLHVDNHAPIILKNLTLKQKVLNILIKSDLKKSLLNANAILPVYSPIQKRIKQIYNIDSTIVYNTINPSNLTQKKNYISEDTFKIISVGRQFYAKDVSNIIKSIRDISNIHFTIIGDGPLHTKLELLVKELNIQEKVMFIKSLSNDEICKSLFRYDAFVTHTDFYEVSKCFIECFNVGLPVVTNNHHDIEIDELVSAKCLLVNNTIESYKAALQKIISSQELRENMGKSHKEFATKHLSAMATEQKHYEVYNSFL